MDKPKVVAIIQARMGSTRLPGKVLTPLAGKPVLWHLIHRLRKAKTVDVVAIATSTGPVDDPLVDFAVRENIPCVRGPEDNVLERYLLAAEQLEADVVIRVTGDAPFVDPGVVDQLVEKLLAEKAEYCVGRPGIGTIHEGFCPFTREALERMGREAANDPIAREHVSAYFKEHPDSFRIVYIDIDPRHHFSGARMSIDTPADLRFAETIYQRLGAPAGEVDMAEVVALLRNEPELLRINNHVYQKKALDQTRTFFFRCDGSSKIGLGHVVRCLALAEVMRDEFGYGITFVMAAGETGRKMVADAGFPVVYSDDLPPENSLLDLVRQKKPDGLVFDIRRGLSRKEVAAIRQQGMLIVDIDDPTDLRFEADLAFYPPVPQVEKLDWQGFTGKLHIGWEWVILRPQFAGVRRRKGEKNGLNILVSMGGSDPAGLTEKVVDILAGKAPEGAKITVVVGAGCRESHSLHLLAKNKPDGFRVLKNVENMAGLMAESDLAIVTFGVTAYELAAMGTPMILLCLDEDHLQSATIFCREGMAKVVDVRSDVGDGLLGAMNGDFFNGGGLAGMQQDTAGRIDGLGAGRIARTISRRFNKQGK